MRSALSLRVFGEDITTAAREAAEKRRQKAGEGEATPEVPQVEEAAGDNDTPVLEDGNAVAPEEPEDAEVA